MHKHNWLLHMASTWRRVVLIHYDGCLSPAVAVINSHPTGVTALTCSSACLLAPIKRLNVDVNGSDWFDKLFLSQL